MCRAKVVAYGSKEHVERLQRWSLRGKSWAEFSLGNLYAAGCGVTKDMKRAFELTKLAADRGNHNHKIGQGYFNGPLPIGHVLQKHRCTRTIGCFVRHTQRSGHTVNPFLGVESDPLDRTTCS